jgi:hypothetical protein
MASESTDTDNTNFQAVVFHKFNSLYIAVM